MTIQDFEQLRRLQQGHLSKDELRLLKQKSKEDHEFREEAIDYLFLMRQIKETNPNRSKVKALLAGNTFESPLPRAGQLFSLMQLASAATVLLALGLGLFLWLNHSAQSIFDLPPGELHIVSDYDKSATKPRPPAERSFYDKKYHEAAQGFYQAYLANPQENILLYNYGIAAYWDKNWPEAQKTFQTLASTPFAYRENAELYWAISLLADKKQIEGERILRMIANNPKHAKNEIAKNILNKMKKN
jgi:hypothetical protein